VTETGCVIAYSSFNQTPPANSLFGRTATKGDQVLCTNPAALAGGSGPLTPYFSTSIPGAAALDDGVTATPWVTYPGLLTSSCQTSGGATWLNVANDRQAGDTRPLPTETLGPSWGLHLDDMNIALGNLVAIVQSEATAYLK
jgi:hypothetical protein